MTATEVDRHPAFHKTRTTHPEDTILIDVTGSLVDVHERRNDLQVKPHVLSLEPNDTARRFAWYRHLREQGSSPLWIAIATSWGIAFFEYCLMVPANRLGYGTYTLPQLKLLQEVITLAVFAGFAVWVMGQRLTLNHLYAGFCLLGAVYFTFRA